VHGVAFSIHHVALPGRLHEVAGQPCCVVAHVPPLPASVHVSSHSHMGRGSEGGGGGEGGAGGAGGGKQYIQLFWVVGSSSAS